jgi:hypothetical protein
MVVASNNRGLPSDTSSTNNTANDARSPQNVDGVKAAEASSRGRESEGNTNDVRGVPTRAIHDRNKLRRRTLRDGDNVERFDERTIVQDSLATGVNRDSGVTTGADSRISEGTITTGNIGSDVNAMITLNK